jgi:phosphatidylglycerol:prolipoprotein diacylglycerol transferase
MFPQIFKIGSFFIPTYGVLVSLGLLLGLWMTARLGRQVGMNAELLVNLGIYCAIAGIIGAKLLMFVFEFGYYLRNPKEIFSLSSLQAGGVFQGGLLLALLTAAIYIRKYHLPGLATADVFAPGVALGHAIGRLGCFSAGCCWGVACHRPWAVTFTNPEANEITGVPLNVPLHPTQLYEAFAEGVIFVVLYRWIRHPHRPGSVIGLYLTLYSTARFIIEFYRAHDESNPLGGPLSVTQWIALGLFAAGVWLISRRSVVPTPPNQRTSSHSHTL